MHPLITLLIICIILCSIFQAQIKGYLAERVVAGRLSGLPKQYYRVLNDVMLPTYYGSTQIDHIVVSIYGIFVIETKNYKGWITGSEYGEEWTKNVYGTKYSFRNPLKQNYAHIKALEEKLGLPEDYFISIVAFSSNCDIKVKTNQLVVYIGQLRKTITSYTDIKFREEDLEVLVRKIEASDITTKETKKQHVAQIKMQVRNNNAKIAQGICPKCGGNLVQRRGKYGNFTGCSNYPKCRYTQS